MNSRLQFIYLISRPCNEAVTQINHGCKLFTFYVQVPAQIHATRTYVKMENATRPELFESPASASAPFMLAIKLLVYWPASELVLSDVSKALALVLRGRLSVSLALARLTESRANKANASMCLAIVCGICGNMLLLQVSLRKKNE